MFFFGNLVLMRIVDVDGIMIDLWRGIVERNTPKTYDFTAYKTIADMCKNLGLKMQFVLSFRTQQQQQ